MRSFQEPRWIECIGLKTIQSRAPDQVADQVTDGGVGLEPGGVSEGSSYLVDGGVVDSLESKNILTTDELDVAAELEEPASLYTRHCGTDCGSPRASRRPRTSMAVRRARPVSERWGMASSPYDRRERTRARTTFTRILGVFAQG